MNSGADAADQIVNMSLKGIEVMAKISVKVQKPCHLFVCCIERPEKDKG